MPKYSLTSKGNVIQCRWNCQANHEHFVGSYEQAVKYFGIEEQNIKSYGELLNIIIYHQTSGLTIPKLSNELYDILINAMGEHKYWVAKYNRKNKALEILDEAEKKGYIFDQKILDTLFKSDKRSSKERIYAYNKWITSI